MKKILVILLLLTVLMLNNIIINAQTGDGTLTDTNIKYIGRWDTTNTSVYNSYWGGAYFKTKFTGTTVKIKLGGACDIVVNIDNGSNTTYMGANGTVNLTPTPLASGVHTLRVAARFQQQELKFQGLLLDSGATTSAPDTKDIIEFVGDSITTGYGDTNGDISAYAWITGENIGYDHTQISYSGVALVTGYGYNSNKTGLITQYFKLKGTDYTTSPDWDFNKYTPKAVVINIGTNDSTSGCSSATFQSTYITFLQNIRAKLPNAKIFCMRPFGGYFATQTHNAVNSRNSAGDANVYYIDTTSWLVSSDYFSDGIHPTDSGQIKAANLLTAQLKNYLPSGPTPTPTPTPIPGTISIAAGSSSAVGSFQADQYYSGGSAYSNTNTVDVSQITSNPPPAALFNNERYGAMSYTLPGFTAGNSYTATLYFAETYLTSSGSRRFNVSINGATALSNFDIYASAGGQNKAIARSFTTTANSSGQIVIQFTSVTENPKINGISIKPGSTNPTPTSRPTPTQAPTPTPTPTPSVTTTPTPTPGTVSISIAAGRTSALGNFQADQYYSGGSAYSNTNTVDVSQITSNPPPAALFNNERYGAMSYTIPGFTPGSSYTVTLYFAETYLTSSGSRLFNVSLNGATVLSNFDIYASAGGQNKAIARSFTATANSNGQIVIQFISGTENPKINGISIK